MKAPLKILHLSASDSGGAYVFAENLIAATLAEGIIARHLVYTGQHENFRYTKLRWADHLIKTGLHACEKLIQLFHERDKSVRFKFSLGHPGMPAFMLKRICKDYDLIHLHWINKGFINIKHLKQLNKPLVWTCHDLWPVSGGCHLSEGCMHFKSQCGNCHFLKSPADGDLSSRIFKTKAALYPHLNLSFVSPSHWMDQNIAGSALGAGHPHQTIHNGIDTAIFNIQSRNGSSEKCTIGFVAANLNDKNKALYRLIEAIDLLPDKSRYRLLLVGQQKAEFVFQIPVEHRMVSNVSDKSEMAALYNQMDVLVCTSGIETFPTTLMEAYCCGVKGLGFDVGGISEIIGSMDGTCIAPYDVAALSTAIARIQTDGYDRASLAQKASGLFGMKKTALAYKDLYLRLLDQK